jgi:hypothetical protein
MIEHPTGTLCRCGHLLECCADCRAWHAENAPRIDRKWHMILDTWGDTVAMEAGLVWTQSKLGKSVDFCEALYFAHYRLRRFEERGRQL